jgi:hypothetical protein
MILPYKRRPAHRSVGLVARTDGGPIVADFEDSARIASPLSTMPVDRIPPNVALYIDGSLARSYLRQGIGEAEFQNGVMTRYTVNRRQLYPLPADLGIDLSSLMLWRDWIEDSGGSVRSKTGTALTLLRASLHRPLQLAKGEPPPLDMIVGGRIHGTGFAMHPSIQIWDISAAYARTLADLRIDGGWREASLDLDNGAAQFADATIRIPSLRWGPLPRRNMMPSRGLWFDVFGEREFPTGKRIRGIWSADELRSALGVGVRIERINRAWRLYSSSRRPFSAWWSIIERGRELPGKAGALAKITGNVLWGVFAGTMGKRERIRYGRGRKIIREPIDDSRAVEFHRDYALAELITSHIRAKVYDELMVPAGEHLISVCVDGGLVEPNGFSPNGDHWRLKDSGSECAFFKPYVFAYRQPSGRIVYKMAGVRESERRKAFEDWRRWAFGSRSPANPTQKQRALYRLIQAFEGSCIDRPNEPSEVDRYFGSVANVR